jgi:hypothetical protein
MLANNRQRAQPNRISSWPGREIMSIMALFACQVIAAQPNLYRQCHLDIILLQILLSMS